MIIKDRKSRIEKPDGCLRWGVCFDSSEKSKKVLQCVLMLMSKNDKLVVYTVRGEPGQASDDIIRHHIHSKAHEAGVKNFEVDIIDKDSNKRTCEQLEEHIYSCCSDINKHGYVDFVAVGNVGMNFASRSHEKYLGSVANAILRMRKLNTIFVA